MTNQFEVGKTYATRSIGDHNCIFAFTVEKRSAKFVTLTWKSTGKVRRVGVFSHNNSEACAPLGHYSMAPTLVASEDLVETIATAFKPTENAGSNFTGEHAKPLGEILPDL